MLEATAPIQVWTISTRRPRARPRLFTLFAQSKTELERSEGGLGIGLSLVRGVVTLPGGSVEARWTWPGASSLYDCL